MPARYSTTQDIALSEGVSVAVFEDRTVLLVRRKRPPFAGLWSLPGGKVEAGETPRETACRELREETGIDARIQGIADTTRVLPDGAGSGYRLTVFYGQLAGGALQAGGDAEAAEWVGLDEMEALPMTPGTAELVWLAAHRALGS